MFRSPQILALICPVRTHRPLQLSGRDPRVPALPEHACQRWTAPKTGRSLCQGDGGEEAVSLSSAISSHLVCRSTSSCESCLLNAAPQHPLQKTTPPNRPQLSQDSSFVSLKLTPRLPVLVACDPWKTTLLEHLDNSKVPECFSDLKCLLQRRQNDNGSQCLSAEEKVNVTFSVKSVKSNSYSPVQSDKDIFHRLLVSTSKLWSVDPQRSLSLQSRGLHQAAASCPEGALRECLSLVNEARCRQSLRPNVALYEKDVLGKRGSSEAQGKWASVLVSLCSVEGEPAFLFTLRSTALKGRHKGDVSFAGGKRDPSDKDVVDTALREAGEELGVTVATNQVWGVLKPLTDMSGMMIAPVLANLGPLEALSFKPNPAEVEEIFTLSLSHVRSPQNRGYTNFRTGQVCGLTMYWRRSVAASLWSAMDSQMLGKEVRL
uniref:Nudix hydrolase 8 n=1 Tax=Hucho hucho TaxID=62062 RepID=A0A4W5PWF4_9TELE